MDEVKLRIPMPSEKQRLFLSDTHMYVGYGGARGGGKSWAVRVKAVLLCMKYEGIKVMIVRKTYPELQENHIQPLIELLRVYHENPRMRLAKYNDSKKHMVFPNGSRILFKYCDSERDAERFQGTEVDILFVDEATHQSEEKMKKITACVRGVNNFPRRIYYTCNPGGEGHAWVKRLFIDKQYEEGENPADYSFIQSSVYDNKALMREDPNYVKKLEALPPNLKQMWLYGNWDIYEGQFFNDFRAQPDLQAAHDHGHSDDPAQLRAERRWVHVIDPIDLSTGRQYSWRIFRSYDFGYGKPFSCAWWAVDYDGTLYRILELYGWNKMPNEGIRWTPDQQFKEIARIEREHPWLKNKEIDGVADPSIWDASHGESIAETAMRHGVYFTPGDNERIPGWMQCHYRLQFDENGYPRMYVFNNCEAFIRTIPSLLHSKTKPEDLDTDMEDHCLIGETEVLTESGYMRISDMVGTTGRVLSSDGKFHQYCDVRKTQSKVDVYTVELENGSSITGTKDHRLMDATGKWITIGEIIAGETDLMQIDFA